MNAALPDCTTSVSQLSGVSSSAARAVATAHDATTSRSIWRRSVRSIALCWRGPGEVIAAHTPGRLPRATGQAQMVRGMLISLISNSQTWQRHVCGAAEENKHQNMDVLDSMRNKNSGARHLCSPRMSLDHGSKHPRLIPGADTSSDSSSAPPSGRSHAPASADARASAPPRGPSASSESGARGCALRD